jgi:protein involved in polysaccharide export with SLBB domain
MNPSSETRTKTDATHQNPGAERSIQSLLAKSGCVLAAMFSLLLGACQSPQVSSIPPRLAGKAPTTLAVGDIVKFTYPGAQEYNHVQKVRTDGRVSLPLIGQVQAAGKNVGSFQAELVDRYASKLQNKEVIVSVELSSIPVYVSGAVQKPGRITLDRSMTVLEAIMEANGFTNRANPSRVVLIRQDGGRHYTKTFNLAPALKGQPSEAFYLKPYDVIVIPESFF